MLRRDQQIRTQIHQIVDACIFAISLLIAYVLRSDPVIVSLLKPPPVTPFNDFAKLFFVSLPGAPLILEWQGFYNRPPLSPRSGVFWPLFKGCVLTTIGLILVAYVFLHIELARAMMIAFGCISFCIMFLKEELFRLFLKSKAALQQYHRSFIIAGTDMEIARMRREIQAAGDKDVEIVAELDLNQKGAEELTQMLHEHSAYGVILSARHTYFDQIENVIKACETEGVEVWLMADFFATQISRTSVDEMLGRPLLVFRTTPESSWHSLAKVAIDFLGSAILLLLCSPIFVLVAIAIKISSPGPVLFTQQRSGQNGRPFTLYKFRTMVTNAEQYQHELAAMNEMRGPVFKVTKDPRVTPIGKFLRKYSLDELPQLWNVARGEMSLVGPRPLPVDEVKRFSDLAHRRRLSVKPGLTCLWQIGGRNQIFDFKDWVRLDLEYIDNWSLWLDFKILLLTIPAVFRGTGAK